MQSWEYTYAVVTEQSDGTNDAFAEMRELALTRWYEKLNRLGAEGWELVSERQSLTLTYSNWIGTLKRPKQ